MGTRSNGKLPTKKLCRRCKKRKTVKSQFYRCPANPDGVRSYCKDCGKGMSERYRTARAGKKRGKGATKPAKRKPQRKPAAAKKAS